LAAALWCPLRNTDPLPPQNQIAIVVSEATLVLGSFQ
jgi:hypothetical protein